MLVVIHSKYFYFSKLVALVTLFYQKKKEELALLV